MTRLSNATLAAIPEAIARPRRSGQIATGPITTGIVHFGPGAFHRAHQAAYVDTLLDHDPRWGIAAVSLRSAGVIGALKAQDGLYTLAIRDVEPAWRVIGAHTRFIRPDATGETLALLGNPAVRLVTATVTEKGYCLAPDGTLDFDDADIRHDIAAPASPRSLIGWLVAGLAIRRDAGIAPFVPMPCDNMADNGAKLHAALVVFARASDPGLADWIEGEVRVPGTMVDSITPAADARLFADVAAALGVEDRAAVQREAFAQWVIEDVDVGAGPDLAAAGAIVTSDVAGYERAKLRILNGAHSTLAYAGLLRGHASVDQAMRDAFLADLVDAMIRNDTIPVLPVVPGLDLPAYSKAVLARFANPAIVHLLEQIAQDGSQKLPYRLADTIDANRRIGRMPQFAVAAIACWVVFGLRRARSGVAIVDPAAPRLVAAAADGEIGTVTDRLIAADLGLRRSWRDDAALVTAIAEAARHIDAGDWNIVSLTDL